MKKYYFLIIFIFFTGCSTAQLTVTSEPEQAEVLLISPDGVESKIGVTPFSFKPEDYARLQGDAVRIGVSKKGFVKEQVLLEKKWFENVGNLKIKLTSLAVWEEVYQDTKANKYLNDVGSSVAEIQGHTVKGDYGRAETLAKSLVTRYPNLAVGWSLLGNIYYLQKRTGDALENYQKALNLNPDSQETRKIIDKIKGVGNL